MSLTRAETSVERSSDFISSQSNKTNSEWNKDFCFAKTCIKDAQRMIKWMDPKVDYCDSFYNFTCGSFMTFVSGNKLFHSFLDLLTSIFFILNRNRSTSDISPKA